MDTQPPLLQEHVRQEQYATPTFKAKPVKTKKRLVRRADRDYSQLVRRSYQAAFLLLNVWLGGIFYFWVRGISFWAMAAGVAVLFFGIVGYAKAVGLGIRTFRLRCITSLCHTRTPRGIPCRGSGHLTVGAKKKENRN